MEKFVGQLTAYKAQISNCLKFKALNLQQWLCVWDENLELHFGGGQDGQDQEWGSLKDIRVSVHIGGSQLVETLDAHFFFLIIKVVAQIYYTALKCIPKKIQTTFYHVL